MLESLTIKRPDDWHVHLRDGALMRAVVPFTARQFARAIVMPNLNPPISDIDSACAYRDRILAAVPSSTHFEPLMAIYLTDETDAEEVAAGFERGVFAAAKLYPANATTNSARGVTDVRAIDAVLKCMEKIGMPLLVHGEVTDPAVDVFDREVVFIDRVLAPMIERFPGLKIVFEHVTTADALDFVTSEGPQLAATITAHHLLINRNAMFEGGIRPHYYCLPVAKRERHRLALRAAATSGDPKFFLGTDSAPHPIGEKESACGCAGIFTAPTALALYAQVFEEEGQLDQLEAFAAINGARFYGLEVNADTVTLERGEGEATPERVKVGEIDIHPFRAGEKLAWRLAGGVDAS
jgi:dihydroorotase